MKQLHLIAALMLAASLGASAVKADTTLLQDNFNLENGGVGTLNYAGFANWTVSNGTVDLIGNGLYDFYPGNGLYVDLDGTSGQAGTLTSDTDFNLTAGTYLLSFDLGGSTRGDTNLVGVNLGTAYSEEFTRLSGDPLATVTRTITVGADTTGNLSFHNLGGDDLGAILDNVSLVRRGGAVPEPSTLVMALGGLVAPLAGLRRKIK